MPYFRLISLLSWLALTIFPLSVRAEVGVVFGSYLEREYADEKRLEVEAAAGVRTVVVTADVEGIAHYRVAAVAANLLQAEEIRRSASDTGLDSWLINLTESGYQSDVLSEVSPPR